MRKGELRETLGKNSKRRARKSLASLPCQGTRVSEIACFESQIWQWKEVDVAVVFWVFSDRFEATMHGIVEIEVKNSHFRCSESSVYRSLQSHQPWNSSNKSMVKAYFAAWMSSLKFANSPDPMSPEVFLKMCWVTSSSPGIRWGSESRMRLLARWTRLSGSKSEII